MEKISIVNDSLDKVQSLLIEEKEGDLSGELIVKRVILIAYYPLELSETRDYDDEMLTFALRPGFVLGKSPLSVISSKNYGCNLFIFYSEEIKQWCLQEISSYLIEEINGKNELYLCISDAKDVDNSRFKRKIYHLKDGEKVKISETLLEFSFHL